MISSRTLRLAALSSALLTPASAASAATAPRTVEAPVLRLAIGDGRSPEVRIAALSNGRTLLTHTLATPASSVVALGDGRHVGAVQYAGDRVDLLDGGAWTENHVDHLHSYVAKPKALPKPLMASDPAHLIAHGDDVLVFADGAGEVHRYGLSALAAGKRTFTTLPAGRPHHGVAVPFGNGFLVTTPAPTGALPNGVALQDATGKELSRFGSCDLLHGEATGDHWAAFGCGRGTLLVEGEGTPTSRFIAYPASAGTARVGTWNATPSGRHLVGALGTAGILILDRQTGTQQLVRIDGAVHAAAVDTDRATAVVLTRDGKLHVIAVGTGKTLRETDALDAFQPASGEGAVAPRLAVAEGRIVITDPARGRVLGFRLASLKRTLEARIGAAPQSVAILGVPAAHDHDH
jgi:hypothetical protein